MSKFHSLTLIFIISAQVQGGEVEDFCKLTKAQSEAKAATLAWPKLYGAFGRHPLIADTTVYGGVNQSLSGIFQALAINDSAYYQCQGYRSEKTVLDNLSHLDEGIFLKQFEAQRPLLKEALKLAEKNVLTEQRLFKSQDSSLADLQTAYDSRDKIQSTLVELEQKFSKLRDIPSVDTTLDLRKALEDSAKSKARAAYLTSAATTLSAWDAVATAGVKHDFQFGTTGAYATVELTYSFGHVLSSVKTSSVDGLMRKYLASQDDSSQNMFAKILKAQSETLATEKQNNQYLASQLKSLQELLDKTTGLDSIRAKRAKRNLTIQYLMQKAALASSTTKMAELEKWVSANSG